MNAPLPTTGNSPCSSCAIKGVGCAPSSNSTQVGPARRTDAWSSVPSAIVKGSPLQSMRMFRPGSQRLTRTSAFQPCCVRLVISKWTPSCEAPSEHSEKMCGGGGGGTKQVLPT